MALQQAEDPVVTDRLELYRLMFTLRSVERKLEHFTYYHSAYGEEAVQVGAFFGLRADDVVFPQYRGNQIVFYMRGMTLEEIFNLYFANKGSWSTGLAPAYSGDPARNILPQINGILGPQLTISAGRALVQQLEGGDSVTVCSFGDGSVNTPSFHAALNLAALWKLPIVFVCQNNNFQVSASVESVNGNPRFHERAASYGVRSSVVDGNDVIAVEREVREAVALARQGAGPSFIETKTYRMHGHVERDPANYRAEGELERWRAKDPVERLRASLLADTGEPALQSAEAEVEAAVAAAFDAAESQPPVGREDLALENVYAPSGDRSERSI